MRGRAQGLLRSCLLSGIRVVIFGVIFSAVFGALGRDVAAAPRYHVTLTTLSAGEDAFERFGHTVLAVDDTVSHSAFVYSFGTFDGDAPYQLHKALNKQLRYWVIAMSPLMMTLRYDHREGAVQELGLDDTQAALLMEKLTFVTRRENREYPYDLFTDNCVTRIRDHLDEALGGALQRYTAGPAPYTFRQQVLQNLAPVPLIAALAMLLYGPYTDVPRSHWESLFLPEALRRTLAELPLGAGNPRRPLLQKEWRYKGEFWTPPHQLPQPLWGAGIFGLLLSSGIFCQVRGQTRRARAILGGTAALLALLMGTVGLVLCYLRTTPHLCFQNNGNSLLLAPCAVLAAPLFVRLAGDRLGDRGRGGLILALLVTALLPVGHLVLGHLAGRCVQVHGAVWIVSAALNATLVAVALFYSREPRATSRSGETPTVAP